MKGRYCGINEGLERLMKPLMVIAVIMGSVQVFCRVIGESIGSDSLQGVGKFLYETSFPLFGIVFIPLMLTLFTPCGFKADERGFTMSTFGIFRKRYLYDDIEGVTIDTHIRVESHRRHITRVSIINMTVTERSGKKAVYSQRTFTNLEKPFIEPNEGKIPAFIRLYEYIQTQMGRPIFTEQNTPVQPADAPQPAHPLITMAPKRNTPDFTAQHTISLGKPAASGSRERTAAADSSRVTGYFMGCKIRLVNTYQILIVMIPFELFIEANEHGMFRALLGLAAIIGAIAVLSRLSVNPPCRFSADEKGFSITVGNDLHRFSYSEIIKVEYKTGSRLINRSYVKLTLKTCRNPGLVFYESSRLATGQHYYDQGAHKAELVRLYELIQKANEEAGYAEAR